jgi:formylglycine-generating enzyme
VIETNVSESFERVKTMKRAHIFVLALCLNTLLAGVGVAEFSFTAIGNPGNFADSRIMDDGTAGYGTVGYAYAISRCEVSNAEWALFDPDHSSEFTGDSKPVQNVSWYDAVRYCNWLTSGSIHQGAYLLNQDGSFAGIDREAAIEKVINGQWNRLFVLPTEDEWHKAAFYDAATDSYHEYATPADTPPVAGTDSMYNQIRPYDGPWNSTNGTTELNGTRNMMGNVWEWTESAVGSYKVLRGGAYATQDVFCLSAGYRHYSGVPHSGFEDIGFRVVMLVPEPASFLLLAAGGLAILRRKHPA